MKKSAESELKKFHNSIFEFPTKYDGLDSFNLVRRKGEIFSCRVHLVKCSTNLLLQGWKLSKLDGIEIREFDHTFYLLRSSETKFPYNFSVFSKEKVKLASMNLLDVKEEKIDDYKMNIQFILHSGDSFTLEFRFSYDLLSVKRILLIKGKRTSDEESDMVDISKLEEKTKEQSFIDRISIKNNVIKNYSNKIVATKKKKRRFSLSTVKRSCTVSAEPNDEMYLDLYLVKSEKWKGNQVFTWFQQIPYHEKSTNKLISLYTYIERENLILYFNELFQNVSPFISLRRIIQNHVNTSSETTENEDDDDEEEEEPRYLQEILGRSELVERLHDHFRMLSFFKNGYNPFYYVVLKKRVTIFFKNYNNNNQSTSRHLKLRKFEELMLFKFTSFWDESSLRRKLCFNFLFGMSLEDYIQKMEQKFHDYMRNIENGKPFARLKSFNEQNGFELDRLSLTIHLKRRYWEVQHEIDELETRHEHLMNLLANDCKLIQIEVESVCEKKILAIEELRKNVREEDSNREKKMRTFELATKKFRSIIPKEVNKKANSTKKELEILGAQISKKKDYAFRVRPTTIHLEKLVEDAQWKFYAIPEGPYFQTQTYIIERKLKSLFLKEKQEVVIVKKLEEEEEEVEVEGEGEGEGEGEEEENDMENKISEEIIKIEDKQKNHIEDQQKQQHNHHGVITISTKLVISRRINQKIRKLEKLSVQLMRKFNLDCCDFNRLGFNHAYIILNSLGLHWFQNETIYVDELSKMAPVMNVYEDLACIDAQNMEFFRASQFMEFVFKLARVIVDWNANYTYSVGGLKTFRSKYSKNCQEFALSFLTEMGLPYPFYPRVDQYLDELTDLHHINPLEAKTTTTEEEEEEEHHNRKKKKNGISGNDNNRHENGTNLNTDNDSDSEEEEIEIPELDDDDDDSTHETPKPQLPPPPTTLIKKSTPPTVLKKQKKKYLKKTKTSPDLYRRKRSSFSSSATITTKRSKKKKKKKNKKITSTSCMECYRYLKIPDNFPDDIKNEVLEHKKQEFVYFQTHQHLDLFVNSILEVVDDAEDLIMRFPGVFSLLKAYDRSFWVMWMYRKQPPEELQIVHKKSGKKMMNVMLPSDAYEPLRDEEGNCLCHFFSGMEEVVLKGNQQYGNNLEEETKKKEEEEMKD